jgi:hypothetical protein
MYFTFLHVFNTSGPGKLTADARGSTQIEARPDPLGDDCRGGVFAFCPEGTTGLSPGF